MKRDIDLARQLLRDIEKRGADCSVSVLHTRTRTDHEYDEQIRYHLRLLIDAGLLKEIDRTSEGIPCVRLTNDAHEFLELTGSESRWREVKYACQERTGGLSLSVIQSLLMRWALGPIGREWRRPRAYFSPGYRPESFSSRYREESAYHVEPHGFHDHDGFSDHDARYVRVGPEYRDRWARAGFDLDGDGHIDTEFDTSAPGYVL